MDHAAMSETVYAKPKELTEEQKAERDEREERELGGWESEGLRQTIFITLEEADSSVAAKIVSLVVMVVIFLSSCTFIIETHPDFACRGFAVGEGADQLCINVTDSAGTFDAACVGCDAACDNMTAGCVCVAEPACDMVACDDTSGLCVATPELTASESAQWAKDWREGMHTFEMVCILIFTVEWLLRMATCTARPREDKGFCSYFLKPLNLIDMLAILPWYIEKAMGGQSSLAILRMLRMTRIFRVVKAGGALSELQLFVEGYKRAREGLLLLFFLLFLYLCVFAATLYMLEYDAKTIDCFASCMVDDLGEDITEDGRTGADICYYDVPGDGIGDDDDDPLSGRVVASDTYDEVTNPGGLSTVPGRIGTMCDDCGCATRGFTSIPTTWYFIMATMTTVGYGDHYPLTVGGRVVCGLCMLCGIMVLALPIIVIGNAFEEVFAEEKRLKAEKERKLALKKLEREMQDGTASEETKAKMAEIEREAALKADSSLHIDTCIRTTSTLLENLKKDTDDLRFQKAYAEILKD